MIGEFNRQNPYVVQIMENIEPLAALTLETTKGFTINFILGSVVGALATVSSIGFKIGCDKFICIYIAYVWIIVSLFKYIMKRNPNAEATRIIYGNQYENIYVNNELLLELIEDMAGFKNSLIVFDEACRLMYKAYLI